MEICWGVWYGCLFYARNVKTVERLQKMSVNRIRATATE